MVLEFSLINVLKQKKNNNSLQKKISGPNRIKK